MLYNKWRLGKVSWSKVGPFPWSNTEDFSGIVPIPVILDEEIGSEIALHVFDYSSFAFDIAKLIPFNLHLKSGIVRCSSGLIYANIFYLDDPKNSKEPFAIYEHISNPHDPNDMQIFWDLSRQFYWHLFVIGPSDEVINFFEFKNNFGLQNSLDTLTHISPNTSPMDFASAKKEFQEMYSLHEFLSLD